MNKREAKAIERIEARDRARVYELAGDNVRAGVHHEWLHVLVDNLRQQGFNLELVDRDDVIETLQEMGWYCDADETEDE